MFDKRFTLYNGDKVNRSLCTPNHPITARFITIPSSNDPVVAVAEYNQITIWDPKSKNPCIKRLPAHSQPFYALDSKDNFLCAVGAARSVYSYDFRNWFLSSTWSNCSKFEVTSLHLSTVAPNVCFVAGLDSTIHCGNTKTGVRHASLLGDSRWVGLDKFKEEDSFVGLTENGNFYYGEFDTKHLK
eukprot:TRINITY_DN4727_c0_g1_i2.p1 TRINITY_DN4727_c0_g1~~TRINITY_DN4727_c0_g1_i2.p1  ORF type:complete len:186 (+),score=35.66 TRINITY_DN4727_c0_g1_i2:519-1076(+)